MKTPRRIEFPAAPFLRTIRRGNPAYLSGAVFINYLVILLLYPVSKMILLAVDVRMRPITEDELMGRTSPTGDSAY